MGFFFFLADPLFSEVRARPVLAHSSNACLNLWSLKRLKSFSSLVEEYNRLHWESWEISPLHFGFSKGIVSLSVRNLCSVLSDALLSPLLPHSICRSGEQTSRIYDDVWRNYHALSLPELGPSVQVLTVS